MSTDPPTVEHHAFEPGSPAEEARITALLRKETVGGVLLVVAAAVAIVWANSPWAGSYLGLRDLEVGYEPWHLRLSLGSWAADGLLAVFFFLVGLELKREFVAGDLRRWDRALVPVAAAFGGVLVPALIYVALNTGGDTLRGWAIPTATDIAFALGVLAVFGKGLPAAVRTFLLTLAVVDDLLAIIVIAVFYTSSLDFGYLAAALVAIVVFGLVVRSRRPYWWMLVPLFAVAWAFMHASGVHATVAGVLMGFTVAARPAHGEAAPRTHRYERAVKPWSQGVALPVFAFFAAGVDLVDGGGVTEILGQPVVPAITIGLVVGKLIGVLGTTALVTRLTPLRLAQGIGVRDLLPVGFLAGIGFTVALLVSELSFGHASEHTEGAKAAILLGSVIAAVLGALTLRWDARRARTSDMNLDGVDDAVADFIGDEKDRTEH